MNRAVQYVIYRFENKEKVNLEDLHTLSAITQDYVLSIAL